MSKSWKKTIFIVTGLITIGLVFLGTFLTTMFYIDGKIMPNTYVAGVNLSYKSTDIAEKKLNRKTKEYMEKNIEIQVGEYKKNISIKNLGVTFLNKEVIEMIGKINTDKTTLVGLNNEKEKNQPLLISINKKQLAETLEKEFLNEEQLPVSASYYIENRKLKIKDGVVGKKINTDSLEVELKKIVSIMGTRGLSAETEDAQPTVSTQHLLDNKKEVSEKLLYIFAMKDPIYSENFKERLIDNPTWVIFEDTSLKINKEEFNKYIDKDISKWLDKPNVGVKIFKSKDKKVEIEGQGHNGSKIEREKLREYLEKAVNQKVSEIPIPTVEEIPKLQIEQGLQDLGIKERIGIGHTSYYGSPASRVHNIKTATQKFNGVLLAPGETFSFNKRLGIVDETTGYKKELVIKPEGTIPEYGGGICQVSTTMYRVALFSGVGIAERNQHSYAVSYYSQILGHGLDATIYLGGADLKIVNDTPAHLLIQAYTQNDYELYFVFYGTSDGRTVEMEGPYLSNNQKPPATIYETTTELKPGQTKVKERAHPGFEALWYRTVKSVDGEEKRETIKTKYKAMPEKIQVGVSP